MNCIVLSGTLSVYVSSVEVDVGWHYKLSWKNTEFVAVYEKLQVFVRLMSSQTIIALACNKLCNKSVTVNC